jgi:hypothetical protein
VTLCRYHCRGSCGGHFTSLEAFDAHRPRDLSRGGCEWPEDAGLVEVFGTCKIGDPDKPARGVIVYRLVREGKYGAAGRERARGRLRGPRGGLVAA